MAEEMEKAARYYGVELLSMDNKQDPLQAVDNFNNAKTWGCDYYIQYNEDPEANKRIGEMLKADNIPAIAVQVPLGMIFHTTVWTRLSRDAWAEKPLRKRQKKNGAMTWRFSSVWTARRRAGHSRQGGGRHSSCKEIYPISK